MPAVPGKLEITVKISQLPSPRVMDDGCKAFDIDCDGQIVVVTVKPKVWRKLEEAQANYPMWIAAITGKMGQKGKNGFVLNEPAIQVFEKKPKEVKEPPGPPPPTSGTILRIVRGPQ